MIKNKYSEFFYENFKISALKSAREIVPFILKLVKPRSIIDVGCGLGAWLHVFQEKGIGEIMGVDGDWINRNNLLIRQDQFLSFDLNNLITLEKKFDLVVCLEVGEHLPKDSAEIFVESLINLGKVIFFSAAIPFQGGINHQNEQWPVYWVKLFRAKKYLVIDCIRKKFWNNEKIDFIYRQNSFIFVEKEYLNANKLLKEEYKNSNTSMLSVIHPKMYLRRSNQYNNKAKQFKELNDNLRKRRKLFKKKGLINVIKSLLKLLNPN